MPGVLIEDVDAADTVTEESVRTWGNTAVYTLPAKRSRKKPTLPTPWLWISSLQNCKKINFSSLSYQVWGFLLGQPKEGNISFEAFSASQFSSVVAQLCPTLWDPMDGSTPGLPVHHHLPEFTQTHVHWVGDAIQPSQPLSSPSPPAFSLSQHQGIFQ